MLFPSSSGQPNWQLLVVLLFLLTGCGFNKSGVVYPELLETVGWQHPDELLKASSFDEYAETIQQEVAKARVPFAYATREVMFASPAEFKPAAECDDTRGIVLLVHGLSDTAFSMRDLAKAVAQECYIARTTLLPGHGTRPGDLLTTRLSHWTDTVQYLIEQAAADHDHVVVIGFSLGSLLVLTEALKADSPIDAVVTLSPAFYLTTSPWAELTQWLHPVREWLDKEKPDDAYRYEAIPTIAVAQTIKAKKRFHQSIKQQGSVSIPWLLIQSDDDLVLRTGKNRRLFEQHANHNNSQSITYYGSAKLDDATTTSEGDASIVNLAGFSERFKVSGLTHVAIHQSPENHHYGVDGEYRNCGSGGPRSRPDVRFCEQADELWLGPWNKEAPDDGAYGMSTYNPHFEDLSLRVSRFLSQVWQQARD